MPVLLCAVLIAVCAVAFCVALPTQTASAAIETIPGTTGSGLTADDPVICDTFAELKYALEEVRNNEIKYFRLMSLDETLPASKDPTGCAIIPSRPTIALGGVTKYLEVAGDAVFRAAPPALGYSDCLALFGVGVIPNEAGQHGLVVSGSGSITFHAMSAIGASVGRMVNPTVFAVGFFAEQGVDQGRPQTLTIEGDVGIYGKVGIRNAVCHAVNVMEGSLVINGGYFEGSVSTAAPSAFGTITAGFQNADITINGGTFTYTNNSGSPLYTGYALDVTNTQSTGIVINGGAFQGIISDIAATHYTSSLNDLLGENYGFLAGGVAANGNTSRDSRLLCVYNTRPSELVVYGYEDRVPSRAPTTGKVYASTPIVNGYDLAYADVQWKMMQNGSPVNVKRVLFQEGNTYKLSCTFRALNGAQLTAPLSARIDGVDESEYTVEYGSDSDMPHSITVDFVFQIVNRVQRVDIILEGYEFGNTRADTSCSTTTPGITVLPNWNWFHNFTGRKVMGDEETFGYINEGFAYYEIWIEMEVQEGYSIAGLAAENVFVNNIPIDRLIRSSANVDMTIVFNAPRLTDPSLGYRVTGTNCQILGGEYHMPGDEVQVYVPLEDGYTVDQEWRTYTGLSSNAIGKVSSFDNNHYKFTMPANNVSIEPAIVEDHNVPTIRFDGSSIVWTVWYPAITTKTKIVNLQILPEGADPDDIDNWVLETPNLEINPLDEDGNYAFDLSSYLSRYGNGRFIFTFRSYVNEEWSTSFRQHVIDVSVSLAPTDLTFVDGYLSFGGEFPQENNLIILSANGETSNYPVSNVNGYDFSDIIAAGGHKEYTFTVVPQLSGDYSYAYSSEPLTYTHHTYEIAHDDNGHWYACSEDGCEAVLGVPERHAGGVATCASRAECFVCGAEYGALASNNHTGIQDHARVEPSCTQAGKEAYWHCADCDKYFSDAACTQLITDISVYGIIDMTPHDYEWIIDLEPTIGVEGKKHEECSVCGDKKADVTIPALTCDHEGKQATARVEATCTQTGKEAYWYCADCDKHFSDEACLIEVDLATYGIIPVIPHNYQWTVDTPATKTVAGVKHEECTACGDTRSENTPIPVLTCDHEGKQATARVDATCTQTGKEAYWYCADCNKYFSDEACQLEIADLATYGSIPVVAHSYSWVTDLEPALGVEGKKHEECSVCGDKKADVTIPALTYNAEIEGNIATITLAGDLTTGVDIKDIFVSLDGKDVVIVVDEKGSIKFNAAAVAQLIAGDVILLVQEGNVADYEGAKLVLNISINAAGITFTGEGKAIVSYAFAETIPADKVTKVYYVNGESREDMNATFADGKVSFETTHFSTYIVVYEDKDTEPVDPGTDPVDPTDPGTEPVDPGTEPVVPGTDTDAEPAKEGLPVGAIVGIAVGGALLLGVGGFAIFWFVIKKKKLSDLFGKK